MGLRIRNVVLDCNDLAAMGSFWAAVTGYEIADKGDPYWFLRDPTGRDADLILQKVPEQKTVKNRVHFDVFAVDPDTEAQRIESLGAKRLEKIKDWIVMADPRATSSASVSRTEYL